VETLEYAPAMLLEEGPHGTISKVPVALPMEGILKEF